MLLLSFALMFSINIAGEPGIKGGGRGRGVGGGGRNVL